MTDDGAFDRFSPVARLLRAPRPTQVELGMCIADTRVQIATRGLVDHPYLPKTSVARSDSDGEVRIAYEIVGRSTRRSRR